MEDYKSAAIRHLQDAELLKNANKLDNAGHLIGFAAECAIKHNISTLKGITDAPHGHLPSFVTTARKHLGQRNSMFQLLKQDIFVGWDVSHRYCRTGSTSEASLTTWFSETKRLFASANIKDRQ